MTVTVNTYNKFIENLGKKTFDLLNDTYKLVLVNDYTFDGSHTAFSDVSSDEIADGNGYTAGGVTLQNVTWEYDSDNSKTKWDADDITFTASGGAIGPATGAVIFHDDSANDIPILYIDFGGSETAGVGTDFRITFNTNGIISIT